MLGISPIPDRDALPQILDKIRARQWDLSPTGLMAGHENSYSTIDPATEEEIVAVPDAGAVTVERAVSRAKGAAESWARTPPRTRARHLRALVDVLREHRDELAVLDAIDSGNPLSASRTDLDWAVELIELACDSAVLLEGRTLPLTAQNLHFTEPVPYGVVGRIIPFNHPALFSASKVLPPLVAGNAVVLKAPPQTPLAPLRIGELFAEVLPAGLLSVVTGSGVEPGEALVRHADVPRIAFIGSLGVGRAIQRTAADVGVKHVSLELGGKNAMIVLPDADPLMVAAGAVKGMNFRMSQGQSCGSTSRLLVHETLHDEVVKQVAELVDEIKIGHPLEPGVEMGPLVSEVQYAKTMRYIDVALDEGAQLVAGGVRPPGQDRGWFISPTVFADVRPGMRIEQEEVFGPVLSVVSYRDLEDAVRIANGVEYGLTASIWTNDVNKALTISRQMQAGYVWVNDAATHYLGAPFGGHKSSGIGTEEDAHETLSFTRNRTIHVVTRTGGLGGAS